LWDKLDESGFLRLDELWGLFDDLVSSLVNLGLDLGELAGDMGGVAIEDGRVSVMDLSWVVKDDNLSNEHLGVGGWVVLGVGGDVSSLDVLDGKSLNVETNIVTGPCGVDDFVMHLDGLDFSGVSDWGETADHTGLELSGLDTSDWDGTDTTNLVDVLEWESEGLVNWSLWWVEGIKSLEESAALVPWHVVLAILVLNADHVVSAPSGNWDELDLGWVVADLLEVLSRFSTISLYLASEYLTEESSILLQQTIICLTPMVWARRACSLV